LEFLKAFIVWKNRQLSFYGLLAGSFSSFQYLYDPAADLVDSVDVGHVRSLSVVRYFETDGCLT
jgi:hypothetical protein